MLAFCVAWAASSVSAEDLTRQVRFDIPPQPLATALVAFSEQSGVQIVTDGEDVSKYSSPGITGLHPIETALRSLLRDAPLGFVPVGNGTLALVARTGAALQPGEGLETIPVQPTETARKEEPPLSPSEAERGVELEKVTVTAGKRAQDIRAVPGSVAALQGQDLEKRGAQNMEDYLKLVPGVTFSKGDVDQGVPIIRGIATDIQSGQTENTVGIYVDEIAFADLFFPTSVTDMNPFDLERVEVLKGPQGTLFGSGALNGAVRYITHKPEFNVWQSKLMGSYTDVAHGQRKPLGAGMLNIPIGQSAAIRAVGLFRKYPGVIDDDTSGQVLRDVDRVRQSAQRVLGAWQPTDRLDLNLTLLRQRSEQANTGFAQDPQRFVRSDTPTPTPRDSRFDVGNLVATYDFDWAKALSSTSRKSKHLFNQNTSFEGTVGQGTGGTPGGDNGATGGANGIGLEDQNLVVPKGDSLTVKIDGILQEVRLSSPGDFGRWQWLGGVSYQRDNEHLVNPRPAPFVDETAAMSPSDPNQLPVFPTPATPAGQLSGTQIANEQFIILDAVATEKALFGEVMRRLGERWELTAGARLFQTRLVGDFFLGGAEFVPFTMQTESRQRATVKAKGVNPKFSVNFRITPNASAYALASKGFQFGGVQILPPTVLLTQAASMEGSAPFAPYGSSKLWNFELGSRTDWLAHRLQLDATLFYEKWSDLQLTQTDANRIFSFVANLGRAHSVGAELAAQALPFAGLRLRSAAAWVNAVTDEFFSAPAGDVPKGSQLPGAAKFSIANTLSYDLSFGFLGNWRPGLSLTHTHTGKYFNDLQHTRTVGGYELLDAQVHLLRSDFRFQPDLTFTVSNVLDKRGLSNVSVRSRDGDEDYFFVKPRTGVLSLAIQF